MYKTHSINKTRFGGGLQAGQRKRARPIQPRKSHHVTFRSRRARGAWNFLRGENVHHVEQSLQQAAERFDVKVDRFQNVGNHFHLLIRAKTRESIQNFLRVFPQLVAFRITGTKKGKPIGRFWDELAFSRVVDWGRDLWGVQNYLEKNRFEALGMPRDVVDLWWKMGEPAR